MSATLRAAVVLLGTAHALTSCVSNPTRGAVAVEGAATSDRSSSATVRRARGNVDVRLTLHENADALEIAGVNTAGARVERRGARVTLDGGAARDEIVLRARNDAVLSLGERCYRGELRVRANPSGGLLVVNRVELEDYIEGVVASEVALWSTPFEALRAQAVAARSYAVCALDQRGRTHASPFLFDDVRDQAYRGVFRARNAREQGLVRDLRRAVESTRGVVLIDGEHVVDARFHAACGGATCDGREVFLESADACLASAVCAPCSGTLGGAREAGSVTPWRWSAARAALDELALRWKLGRHIVRLDVLRSDDAGRWLELEISGDSSSKRLRFEELRRALGADKLPGSMIVNTWPHTGERIDNGLLFEGRGRGHGVGLCQVGACAYAQAGWSAEQILAHYYRGATCADFR